MGKTVGVLVGFMAGFAFFMFALDYILMRAQGLPLIP